MLAMEPVRIRIARLAPDAQLPDYHSADAAGLDLPAAVAEPIVIAPGAFHLVPCGFAVEIPRGFEGQVRPRSGLANRHGVTVLNTPGTIDSDYRGEVKVLLINHGPAPFTVTAGMRVAQLVVARVARVEWEPVDALTPSGRGEGGFGHTG